MKKGKLFCLALATGVMSFTLASCGGVNNSSDTIIKPSEGESNSSVIPNDERKVIYELALKSGYEGTYEEWLDSIKGDSIELRVSENKIQWKYTRSNDWKTLASLDDLKGAPGEPGKDGSDGEAGKDGQDGKPGKDGSNGLPGKDGEDGKPGKDGSNGLPGKDGQDGKPGKDGSDGLPGKDGQDGKPGKDGQDGDNGLSAYEIYKKYHPEYKGSEEDWINDLVNGKLATMVQITLNYMQPDMKTSEIECKKGELYTLPTPTKDGFKFLGWRDENGDKVDVSSFKPTRSMTLYAIWEKITTTLNSIYSTYYNLGDPNIEYCSKLFSDTIKAKDYGFDFYDSNNQYNMELEKLNQALKEKYAGYLINPVQFWDGKAYIDIFKESKSPVVFWNRELDSNLMNSYDKAYYVGFEADEIGRLQGKMAADYINKVGFNSLDRNGDGKLGVIVVRGEKGHPDSDSRTLYAPMYLERSLIGGNKEATGSLNGRAYQAVGFNKVDVKAMVEGKDMSGMTWDPLSASSEVARVLCEKGNEIDLVLSNNDGMALGILKNSIFINSGIPIWGIDGMNDTKIQINKPNSQLKGTIEMNRDEMVRVSVEVLMNLINGDEFSNNLNITNDKTAWENDENKIWYDSAKKALRIHHSIITK